MSSAVAAPDTDGAPARGFGGVVARLTGLNGLLVVVSLITGPVLARVLGPGGRGELSAILAVFVLAPLVLDFGLGDFLSRERARGTRSAAVIGTAMPLALGFSLLGVALALPIAELVGHDRAVVELYVRISLLASPLLVFGWMLIAVARGGERWSILYRWRLINAVGSVVLIVGLALLDLLTVQSAVLATMGTSLVALFTSLPVLRGLGWQLDRRLVRPALAFGARSWLTMLSTVANYRLDQLVLAAVVPSEDLGHYAVAVSLTATVLGFVGAVNTALLPRVAQEGVGAVPRIARVSVLILGGSLGGIAGSAPFLVPLVFGEAYQPTVVLVAILAPGALFLGLSWVLGAALQGHGRPQDMVRPQLLGLAITIGGLALMLGPFGVLGAALVSVMAYAAVLAGTLRASARAFGTSLSSLLLPRVADLRWLVCALRARRGARTSSAP